MLFLSLFLQIYNLFSEVPIFGKKKIKKSMKKVMFSFF